jgi:hypothetical protein
LQLEILARMPAQPQPQPQQDVKELLDEAAALLACSKLVESVGERVRKASYDRA